MVLLDTTFLIDLMDGDEPAADLMRRLVEGTGAVAASAITIMELHHGIARSRRGGQEAARVARAIEGVTTYPVTHAIAARAGAIDGELASKGRAVAPFDVIIAATALEHAEAVVTRNAKDFSRIDGLTIETY